MSNNLRAHFQRIAHQFTHLLMPAPVGGNPEYLGPQHFARVIALVLLLHFAALYSWYRMPHEQVIDIPVRALNIKLGDIDMTQDTTPAASQPDSGNSKDVENTLSKLVQDVPVKESAQADNVADAVLPAGGKKDTAAKKDQDYLSKLAASPKQFVRNSQAAQPAQKIVMGNSAASNAEIMSRYEQLISLWIQKFKLYPDEARARGQQGETVIRIRIDRRGNIGYYILERSTGFQILDKAAIDMIKRANPVPAVPHDYPQGDLMEFLIPVSFHLQ